MDALQRHASGALHGLYQLVANRFWASFFGATAFFGGAGCGVLRNDAEFCPAEQNSRFRSSGKRQIADLSKRPGGGTHVAPCQLMMNETTFPLSDAQTNIGKRLGVVAKRSYAWHALDAAAVIRMLEVDPDQGLTVEEVASRRLVYGTNSSDTLASKRRNVLLLLLFSSVVIGFLLTAAVLNRAVTNRVEAFSILTFLAIMATVGFGYLLKGAHELDAVQDATRSKIRVRRDRQETNVIAEELVPGDIIILGAGDCVSADARLIKAEHLHVQEAALTGKSSDVEKLVLEVPAAAPLEMRQSMVYLGTTISSGSGVAVVVATGMETEVGRIAARDN